MSEDADYKDHSNHICARCATCGLIFDATQGLECPACHRNHISFAWKSGHSAEFWNRGATDRDDEPGFAEPLTRLPHVLNSYGTNCREDCPACGEMADRHRNDIRVDQETAAAIRHPDVIELKRIFSLKDTRN
jgi:hypothetical protein